MSNDRDALIAVIRDEVFAESVKGTVCEPYMLRCCSYHEGFEDGINAYNDRLVAAGWVITKPDEPKLSCSCETCKAYGNTGTFEEEHR